MLRLLFASLTLFTALSAASRDELPEADARAVRAVVEAQLDAFRHDDAARAFSYASDGIRETFGSPENFLAMVRASYPVVYRPRSVAFQPAVLYQGLVVQPVRMIDAEGQGWLAVYPMHQQPDGSWRIDGCRLGRLKGQET